MDGPYITPAFVTGGSGFVGRNLIKDLVSNGVKTKALVRSKNSEKIVQSLGAIPIFGDVNDFNAMVKGMDGCSVVYHLASRVGLEGPYEEFHKITVEGTKTTLAAAKEAGVITFVHCSTESVLLGGPPLINVDETWPYPQNPDGPYAKSKGIAERLVVAANNTKENFKTVVVRPRMIYGPGDTSHLPILIDAVHSGQWVWIGGGNHMTSVCHIRNAIEGFKKAALFGRGGEIYFITDGKDIPFREFWTKIFATQGVDVTKCWSVYKWFSTCLGWGGLFPTPVLRLFGEECTINDSKARKELNYQSPFRFEEALEEMKQQYLGEYKE